MTEKLKTLMHDRAMSPEFEMPDVDLLVRQGTRRARRRGFAVVGAGAAATAVIAGGIAVVGLGQSGDGGDRGPAVATDPLALDEPAYARGSVIHTGDESVEVGHQVRAFVRTDVGYVVADSDGAVWSVAGGDVSRIGTTNAAAPRVVSDNEGTLAGWVDASGDLPAFVFYDQSTGKTTRNDDGTAAGMGELADEADPAYLYAIDGRTGYLRDQRGAIAVDIDTGKVTVIDAAAKNGFELLGVEDGVLATSAGDRGTRLHGSGRDVMLSGTYGSVAVFSPGASWISIDADEPAVFDARNGRRLPIDLDSWFATGYEWLDADTLLLISAESETDAVDLVSCTLPAGTCKVEIEDVGTFDELTGDLALPVGEHLAG